MERSLQIVTLASMAVTSLILGVWALSMIGQYGPPIESVVSLPQSPDAVNAGPRIGDAMEPRRHEPTTYLLPMDDFSTIIVKDNCDFRGYLLPKGQTISAQYNLVSLVDYPLNYTTYLYRQPADEPLLMGVEGRFEPSTFVLRPRDTQILTLTLTAAEDAEDTLAIIAPDTLWNMVNGSGRAGGFGFQLFVALGEGRSFPIDYFYSVKLIDDEGIDKKPLLSVFPRGEEAAVTMQAGETHEVRWRMNILYARGDPIGLNPTARVMSVNQRSLNQLPDGVSIDFSTSTPKIVQNEDFELIMRISVGNGVQPTTMPVLVTFFGPVNSSSDCREEPFHTILDITVSD